MSDDAVPRYVNPVLDADWPDPDAIRVGGDYWMVASSFNRAPGLPLLHSRDLVSWRLAGHALPHGTGDPLPRHGGGVWAPSIRHHDGVFHVLYPDPDRGLLVVSATDPEGEWSAPRTLLPGLGLIDPCPLWDDDGRTWVVHGWAKSRCGTKNRLGLVEVDAGLTRTLGADRVIVDGGLIPGCGTLEGPKLHRRDGWYWILAPAGGVTRGWQSAFRSRHVAGPYEHRVVMRQGSSPVNGPHQGAWVDTPDGGDWFLHFQDRGPFGRVVHLQPMAWGEDGWPVIGGPGEDGWGSPVADHPSPHGTVQGPRSLPGSDDFAAGLGRQWYWQATPQPGWAEAGGGRLLLAGPPTDAGNLRSLPQVLGQQLPGTGATLTTALALEGPEGSRAGVTVLGRGYCWAGLRRDASGTRLVAALREDGDDDESVLVDEPWPEGASAGLRVACTPAGILTLLARPPGGGWEELAGGLPAEGGHWVGAELALVCAAPLGLPAHARATVAPVRLDQDGGAGARDE